MLRARIAERERRYGIASCRVHDAIDAGEIEEREDVCDWIMDCDLLRSLDAERN